MLKSSKLKPREKAKILFGLAGSIACYKACFLISDLKQSGFEIQVVASKNTLRFIGAATLEGLTGHLPLTDLYQQGAQMEHIHLVRNADIFVICPATASLINKIAAGSADDLLSTCFIANNFKTPCILAPAMNIEMLNYPATQKSLELLTSWGAKIILGAEGHLACGEQGPGRMAEPNNIKDLIIKTLA